ncbi:unnamed protein product [Clonostachys byssicola]|uniref:Uncharacterized protein n=1 Tax=Clonostachys byssicola TaxID=160290 RepID=A0A9N9XXE2_9HYPO|nr:unnamed protein product [Clonostachys byssicola]
MESEILQALTEYKDCVTKHNLSAVKRLVEYAATEEYLPEYLEEYPEDERAEHMEETDEEIAQLRLDWILQKLGQGGSELITRPEDVLTHWDVYSQRSGLNGAAFDDRDLEKRSELMNDYIGGLRDGLQALGGEAPALDLPQDSLVLLAHVDTLEGHKWYEEKDQGRQTVFFNGFLDYDQAKKAVLSDDGLKEDNAYLGGRYPDYEHVVAGWKCGSAPEGGCYIIYGRQKLEDEASWFYHVNKGQFGTEMFKSVVDLLKWYQQYNIPDEGAVEYACSMLWW